MYSLVRICPIFSSLELVLLTPLNNLHVTAHENIFIDCGFKVGEDILNFSFIHLLPLQWRRNGHDCVSNHQPHHCLLNRLFGRRPKKTPKLHVTGLYVRNSPGTGEFPAQMASNAENVSIWWRHHDAFCWVFVVTAVWNMRASAFTDVRISDKSCCQLLHEELLEIKRNI